MANAQDLLLAKFALKTDLIPEDVLQECFREQQDLRATGQRIPLIQLLVRRRVVAAEALVPVVRAIEATSFDCLRCQVRWPFSALAALEQLACPRCRGAITIRREDGEAISERLLTSRRFRRSSIQPPIQETKADSGTSRHPSSHPNASPVPSVEGVPATFGPYEIISELGRGGMGVVYKARHPVLDRTVALKVLIAGDMASKTQLKRFQREAELAGKLKHPNIVAIHDVGQIGDRSYFTMDFVDGTPLSDRIKARDLPVRLAIEISRDLARALHHAHEHGVIHRDVKPANVILDRQGAPMLTDFGLAREADAEESARLTREGAAVGTPFYMSPEQTRGDRAALSAASDVYSLGVVLFEMLTFQLPFNAKTQVDLSRKVLTEPAPRLTSVEPTIDVDVENVVLKCLEKDPADRYPTAASLADDLDRYLRGEPILASGSTFVDRMRVRLRKNRRTLVPVAVIAGSVLAVGATAFLVVRHSREAELQRQLEAQRRAEELRRAQEKAAQEQAARDREKAKDRAAQLCKDAESAFADAERTPLAAVEVFQSKLRLAIERATAAIQEDATNAKTFLLRGRAHEASCRPDAALEDYAKAASLEPDGIVGGEAAYREARSYFRRRRDTDTARRKLEALAAKSGVGVWKHLARAATLVLGDRPDIGSAMQEIEVAKRVDPSCSEIYLLTALIVTADEHTGAARIREALDALNICLDVDRKNARAFAVRGRIRAVMGQSGDDDLRNALLLDPDEPMALVTLAEMDIHAGRFQDGLQSIKRILSQQAPNEDPSIVLQSITVHALADDLEGAKRMAVRAAELLPGKAEPYIVLSRAYSGRDLADLAIKELRVGLEVVKDRQAQSDLAQRLVELLLHADRWSEAEAFAKEHLAAAPDDIERMLRLANVYTGKGEAEALKAVALLDQIHDKAPLAIDAYELHVRVLMSLKRPDDVDVLLRRLSVVGATRHEAWELLGMVHMLLGQDQKALDAGRKAVDLDPESPTANARLAEIEMQIKDIPSAMRHAQIAVQRDPNNAAALSVLGVATLMSGGSQSDALNYFQRAVDADPGEPNAAYFLTMMLIDVKPQVAVRVAEAALKKLGSRTPARVYEAAGIAYLANKALPQAEKMLKRSLSRDPDSAQAHAALGEVFLAQGAKPQARVEAEKALKIDPESAPAKRLLRRLEQ